MFATTLTTERLVLREPRPDDAQALFDRYASDPQATRFLSWETRTHADQVREFLEAERAKAPDQRDQHWVLCLKGDDSPWGMATAFHAPRHVVPLGYVLSRQQWGRGLMTEAVREVVRQAWADPQVWRVTAYAHVDNVGSHRVLEKCGLVREGVSRRLFVLPQLGAEPQDCVRYAAVRDDVE